MARTKGRGRAPYASLVEAISVAERIFRDGGGQLPQEHIASALGSKSIASSTFVRKLAALRHFGVVEVHGNTVKLTSLGFSIAAPASSEEKLSSLFQAFRRVDLFQLLHDRYRGKLLPEMNSLKNILMREYDVNKREHAEVWVKAFFDALETVGLIDRRGGSQMVLSQPQIAPIMKPPAREERKLEPRSESLGEVDREEPGGDKEQIIRLNFEGGPATIRMPAGIADNEIEKLIAVLEAMKKKPQAPKGA